MLPHGEIVKRAIKGGGHTITAAAIKLGMSRENLYYYLNSAKVPDEIVHNVNTKLELEVIAPFWEEIDNKSKDGKKNLYKENGYNKIVNQKITSDKKESYIDSPFLTEVLDMGRLLQLPLDQLLLLQASAKKENDTERLNLIHEVITSKMELEAVKRENELLRENIELLKTIKK